MEGMLTHCGAHTVTREEVLAVPKPVWTRSHRPIDYETLITFVERQVDRMGLTIEDSAFALNRKGQHFFGKWVLGGGTDARAPSIVARHALNKQFKLAIGIGVNTFVCDNLSMTASDFKAAAKSTVNGWDTFRGRVLVYSDDVAADEVPEPVRVFNAVNEELETWSELPMSDVDGARYLGELYHRGLFTPQQASVAFKENREPPAHFADRNVLNLYQHSTEALKRGPTATIAERHGALHSEFQALALAG